jgi:hypothetical protein
MLICNRLWRDPRILPAYIAAGSSIVLGLQLSISARKCHCARKPTNEDFADDQPGRGSMVGHIHDHGGKSIFAFRLARAVTVFALLALYVISFLWDGGRVHGQRIRMEWALIDGFTKAQQINAILATTYVRSYFL